MDGRVRLPRGRQKTARALRRSDLPARAFDILLALAALLGLAPLMLLVAILICLVDHAPPFCTDQRVGRDGLVFRRLAYRTTPRSAALRPREFTRLPRYTGGNVASTQRTRLGAFLYKTSIDMLPQLINVLSGQMSIIGPRPITIDDIASYGRYFSYYCQVRPGWLGLWQRSGTNSFSQRRRIAMDVAYVRSKSIGSDLAILVEVAGVLLERKTNSRSKGGRYR